MNGTVVVGISEDFAIHWLKDPKNSAIVTQWISSMKGFQSNVAAIYEDFETKSIDEPILETVVKKKKVTKAKSK